MGAVSRAIHPRLALSAYDTNDLASYLSFASQVLERVHKDFRCDITCGVPVSGAPVGIAEDRIEVKLEQHAKCRAIVFRAFN